MYFRIFIQIKCSHLLGWKTTPKWCEKILDEKNHPKMGGKKPYKVHNILGWFSTPKKFPTILGWKTTPKKFPEIFSTEIFFMNLPPKYTPIGCFWGGTPMVWEMAGVVWTNPKSVNGVKNGVKISLRVTLGLGSTRY